MSHHCMLQMLVEILADRHHLTRLYSALRQTGYTPTHDSDYSGVDVDVDVDGDDVDVDVGVLR